MARGLLGAVGVRLATRRALASLAGAVALGLAGGLAAEPRLRRDPDLASDGEVAAVAVDPAGRAVAVADERGVWLHRDGSWRRTGVRAPVRDLALDGAGALWVASQAGLFRLDESGRLEARALGAGARDRRLTRVACDGGLVAAAGDGGAFASLDGVRFEPIRDGLPAGPVSALNVRGPRVGSEPFELWLSVESELYRVRAQPLDDRLALAPAERIEIAGPGARQEVADLARVGDERRLLVLGSDWLAAEAEGPVWPSERLALLPGSAARRLVEFEGLVWIATDRGLLVAEGLAGPFERAADAAGRTPIHAVAATRTALWVATEDGLYQAGPAGALPVPASTGAFRIPLGEPSVIAVQRAALAWLDLGPERMRSLRRRVDRRGWMPQLDLRAVGALERDRVKDFDEAFTGGQFFTFFDRGLDRHSDLAVTFALTWDLGDAVFHPDSIDLSEEAREVIELRDDILDEITQLYFERRRVLASLAALPSDDGDGDEAARMRLRADELGAGLDAWTGGWWSREVPPLSERSSRPVTQE